MRANGVAPEFYLNDVLNFVVTFSVFLFWT